MFIMSPEDEHLHTDRMQPQNDSLNSDWNANKNPKTNENHTTTNGNGGYINGDTILKQRNGNGTHVDSQTWLPLLGHHGTDIDHNLPTTNNNKWPALNSPANLSNSKYTWKELPQDENAIGLFKPTTNGNALNGLRNVHSDKSEHESLTGIVRSPVNGGGGGGSGGGYTNNNENDDQYDTDGGPNCGIGICKPRWARMFASTHVFMVIFLLAWILQVKPFFFFWHINFMTIAFGSWKK